MDRKEILEKSQLENLNKDPVERECIKIATNMAFSVGLITCCILSVLNLLIKGQMDFLLWVVYFAMFAAREICLYIKIKDKKSLTLGMLFGGICGFFILVYFCL